MQDIKHALSESSERVCVCIKSLLRIFEGQKGAVRRADK